MPPLPPAPEVSVEAPPVLPSEDAYASRDGYRADFLGADQPEAPLPDIVRCDDVLEVTWQGQTMRAIPYRHFSVVMSKSRRVCYVSAVNIDGALSVPHLRRRDWRFDPRFDQEHQLAGRVYGNPPRFSRGHMTRREDPAWGATRAEADEGNTDSMHLANAVPQMQPFNGGIWLGLTPRTRERRSLMMHAVLILEAGTFRPRALKIVDDCMTTVHVFDEVRFNAADGLDLASPPLERAIWRTPRRQRAASPENAEPRIRGTAN